MEGSPAAGLAPRLQEVKLNTSVLAHVHHIIRYGSRQRGGCRFPRIN